jgi:aldehyde dehydrogenase (NAD+)
MMQSHGLFLHGQDQHPSGAAVFISRDPSTGAPVAELVAGDAGHVDAAVRAGHAAFGDWRQTSAAERGTVLLAIARTIREQARRLAELETLDVGQTLTASLADVETAARYFEYYGGAADKVHGETIPLGADYHSYTRNEPFGVVAFVLPWNAPVNQAARGLAPALAMGNVAVVKPAEDASLTTLALAQIAVDCGLPPDVFNVVTGFGPTVGEPLVTHPLVRKVAFTGSVGTGQRIMRLAADRVLPLTLELGGKSPNIIFPDADLSVAIPSSFTAFTLKSGQACSCGTRLLVHKDIHDEVVDGLVHLAQQTRIGPGIDDLDMGALTTAAQYEKVKGYLELGVAEGARLAVGGKAATAGRLADGFFVEPTIFTNVDMSMRIAREEIFGPVLAVTSFADEHEAVAKANDSDYGLVAGVWTTDLARAHRVARDIEAGQVFVNRYFAGGVETPFGGFKSSGFGREKGFEALKHYSQTKTVTMPI